MPTTFPTRFRSVDPDFAAVGRILRLLGEGSLLYFDNPEGAMCGVVVKTDWPHLANHLNDEGDADDETDWRPHDLDDQDNIRTVLAYLGEGKMKVLVDDEAGGPIAYVFADAVDVTLLRLRRPAERFTMVIGGATDSPHRIDIDPASIAGHGLVSIDVNGVGMVGIDFAYAKGEGFYSTSPHRDAPAEPHVVIGYWPERDEWTPIAFVPTANFLPK